MAGVGEHAGLDGLGVRDALELGGEVPPAFCAVVQHRGVLIGLRGRGRLLRAVGPVRIADRLEPLRSS